MRGIVLMPLPNDYTSGPVTGHAMISYRRFATSHRIPVGIGPAADANSIDGFPIE
jgi:hypothetical protein